jgi:hypothetical protein
MSRTIPAIAALVLFIAIESPQAAAPSASNTTRKRAQKRERPAPDDLVRTPLVPANPSVFPEGTRQLEIFLLMGQSNMKGRGLMPKEPFKDPKIIMMHRLTDGFFFARHPLHLVGDPQDFSGSDNAGVGPGLAFARAISLARPESRILLIPCAVGGTAIAKWQKGQRLFDETVRRARLALKSAPEGHARIAGALWLQGEADSGSPERIAAYADRLDRMIGDLRADLQSPGLPFIACTIGEMKKPDAEARAAINRILLDLPKRVPRAGCIDSRAFAKSIGDAVHFDTPTQDRHGRLYAEQFLKLLQQD